MRYRAEHTDTLDVDRFVVMSCISPEVCDKVTERNLEGIPQL